MVNWPYWFLINNTFVLYRLYRWGEDEKQVNIPKNIPPFVSFPIVVFPSLFQCFVIFCSFSRQWKELDRLFLAPRLQVLFHRALLNSFGVQKLQVGRHLSFSETNGSYLKTPPPMEKMSVAFVAKVVHVLSPSTLIVTTATIIFVNL